MPYYPFFWNMVPGNTNYESTISFVLLSVTLNLSQFVQGKSETLGENNCKDSQDFFIIFYYPSLLSRQFRVLGRPASFDRHFRKDPSGGDGKEFRKSRFFFLVNPTI